VLGWAEVLDKTWMSCLNKMAVVGNTVFVLLVLATSIIAALLSGTCSLLQAMASPTGLVAQYVMTHDCLRFHVACCSQVLHARMSTVRHSCCFVLCLCLQAHSVQVFSTCVLQMGT